MSTVMNRPAPWALNASGTIRSRPAPNSKKVAGFDQVAGCGISQIERVALAKNRIEPASSGQSADRAPRDAEG